eukprot:CAMPEP_0175979440 /NCGR_PEP_ID=MMETSP0108-20121206/46231_1 /TAXON_ID=195067 ORGANISM="Goniomonas pacifica, Strain CCMP1869" /NCGR_SAMPLE_ID=MMETSP0108 /ASSEMBLY_ACC=CAM_ASM_000204 /LENGTH=265 /DNA_ID=CAMNT_0017309759 /DNA_START=1 /DNA_END=795 /DNA_ORIENTATION=+
MVPLTREYRGSVPLGSDSVVNAVVSPRNTSSAVVPRQETNRILRSDDVNMLHSHFPARLRDHSLRRVFASHKHGHSLATLLRRAKDSGPTVVAIKTSDGQRFGGFASRNWVPKPKVNLGTGECFVFSLASRSDTGALTEGVVYRWSGGNSHFCACDHSFMAMGGGNGFSWHINSDLSQGSSAPSNTYDNPCLLDQSDGHVPCHVHNVEVWKFEAEGAPPGQGARILSPRDAEVTPRTKPTAPPPPPPTSLPQEKEMGFLETILDV